MLILGIESSAKAASVALCRDGALLAISTQQSGLTHSATLLPMVRDLLRNCGANLSELDAVAVAQGPGSFTGIRIGVSTAKGLCWGAEKPAIGISTLEAMAQLGAAAGEGALICCAMDARREQIYNALFEIRDGRPQRLCEDRAISLASLAEELAGCGRDIFILGDGALMCYNHLKSSGIACRLAPEHERVQNGLGVCLAAMGREARPAEELLPVYLRLSQAERERQARLSARE